MVVHTHMTHVLFLFFVSGQYWGLYRENVNSQITQGKFLHTLGDILVPSFVRTPCYVFKLVASEQETG